MAIVYFDYYHKFITASAVILHWNKFNKSFFHRVYVGDICIVLSHL